MTAPRRVLLVAHAGRAEAVTAAREALALFARADIAVQVLAPEAAQLGLPSGTAAGTTADTADSTAGTTAGTAPGTHTLDDVELVVVLGGDGTILRGAEVARPAGVPLLGVNLGHVGFLAEAERDDLSYTVERVARRDYVVEERMTLDVVVRVDGRETGREWALNEASVEKLAREKMIELVIEVDGRPLSSWGGDGVVLATPTGSTAYAFSAGGPVVWPEVEALLLVPISAHALFARPLVTAPTSVLAVEVSPRSPGAVLWCDGRRGLDLPSGARVEVRRGLRPVRLARLHQAPFTDRLVRKFALPVEGWRGGRASAAGT